jgi:hypothetical protein
MAADMEGAAVGLPNMPSNSGLLIGGYEVAKVKYDDPAHEILCRSCNASKHVKTEDWRI